MPLYESGLVAFYRGAPAPGAPVVPTPLTDYAIHSRKQAPDYAKAFHNAVHIPIQFGSNFKVPCMDIVRSDHGF